MQDTKRINRRQDRAVIEELGVLWKDIFLNGKFNFNFACFIIHKYFEIILKRFVFRCLYRPVFWMYAYILVKFPILPHFLINKFVFFVTLKNYKIKIHLIIIFYHLIIQRNILKIIQKIKFIKNKLYSFCDFEKTKLDHSPSF